MVGIVVATHGHLAQEFVSTAEQIVGKLEAVSTCAIEPTNSAAEIQRRVDEAVASVDSGQGVIVFTDLLGGTACNQSLMLTRSHDLEVITGLNLPMLLKASTLRSEITSLPELAAALARYGQKNITCASALVRGAVIPGER